MLENIETARGHLTASRRAIMIKHLGERLPQKLQVLVAEASLFSEMRRDETMGCVQAIGNRELASHGAIVATLSFSVPVGSYSHTGDSVFLRHNGIARAGKGHLNRTTDLPAVDTG